MLADQRIAEIEERAGKATPGPWWWADHRTSLKRPVGDEFDGIVSGPVGQAVPVMALAHYDYEGGWPQGQADGGEWDAADVTLAMHARQDIPDLIEEVKRLRAVLDAVRALLESDRLPEHARREALGVLRG